MLCHLLDNNDKVTSMWCHLLDNNDKVTSTWCHLLDNNDKVTSSSYSLMHVNLAVEYVYPDIQPNDLHVTLLLMYSQSVQPGGQAATYQ